MRAVIYCRVSTKEQTKNLSLSSQQKTCKAFCEKQGWTVDRVFVERGESAKTANRTELTRLLTYCRENDGRVHVLVVYSLDRFARCGYDHHVVRAYLAKMSITLRSATQPIDESPTGKLMEGVLAAFAQFDNDQRSERTVLGMQEALKRGQWVFPAPLGYRNARRLNGTKTIEPDPKAAPLIRRAFQLYASGLYSQKEVLQQVSAAGLRTKRGFKVGKQSFGKMLRHPLYGGRIQNDEWGIDVKGDFESVVDEHTFYRVQVELAHSRLAGRHHRRNNPDFPLRRFVRCANCESPTTGGWSRSHTGKRYGYYQCRTCGESSTRKEVLEEAFLELLDRLKPKPEYLEALRESVLEGWRERKQALEEAKPILERRLARVQDQKKRLMEAYVYEQAIDEATYRRELLRLDQEITVAKVETYDNEIDDLDVETVLEFAESVVVNARRMWSEFNLKQRRKLQKVLFPEGLAWSGEAFQTPTTCLFFKDLKEPALEVERMVARTGFEPGRLAGWIARCAGSLIGRLAVMICTRCVLHFFCAY